MAKYTRNDDGTLTQETDGGYRALIIDPDGSFEREMSAPAGAADFVAATPHQANVAPAVDPLAGVSAADAAALAQPGGAGPTANPVQLPDRPATPPQVAPLAGGAGPRATLVDSPGAAGPATATTTKSDHARTESVEGLDAESKKRVLDAGAKTEASADAAAQAEQKAGADVAAQREQRAKQDYMSGFVRQVGQLEAEQRYKNDYDAAMAERKAARLQPIDPKKAWGNERNEWAFIAGLGGALAALDEGISRLQKRGGAQPFDMIDKMVESSIRQQEQEREQRVAAAGEDADAARDAMLEARSNAHEAAAQVLDARKLLASSAEEATFLEAAAAKQRLQADIRDEERAKAIATRKSVQTRDSFERVTQPLGPGKADPKAAEKQGQLRELYRIRDTLRRAQKSGDLAAVVGLVDRPKANLKESTIGLQPGQQEALTALGELEVGNLMRLVREPNNVKTQNMVQGLGVPKNDDAIDTQLNRLDALIADQEDAVSGAAPQAPAEQQETY